MTGHGRGEAVVSGVGASVECFSVNRKQAEVNVASAREFAWVEPLVREEVLKSVARGKVQISVSVARNASGGAGLIDADRAAGYLKELRTLQKKLGLSGDIPLETLLNCPGVMRSSDEIGRSAWPAIHKALQQAMEAMLSMRIKEGAHLQKELNRSARKLAGIVKTIRPLAARVPALHREALLKRLQAAGLNLDSNEPRVINEIAMMAERSDVTEELTRLASHHAQLAEKLASKEPIGRTLEFIIQEMGREWNTLGAKAGDAEIARLVVDAKAELDRLREQIANIE